MVNYRLFLLSKRQGGSTACEPQTAHRPAAHHPHLQARGHRHRQGWIQGNVSATENCHSQVWIQYSFQLPYLHATLISKLPNSRIF
jgi:hypothetical protein